ncbi:flagellar biosynthesis protein FlhF [Haloimpatiens sp. FM7330]|uniref:flagellar biosynthesis protein FlhF n=1 Tax=Haloimpatiens sp. FM7330 TaxID=3298610 RepID=UPI00363E4DE8
MKVRKYVVKDMNEAVNKIRHDLGQDAVIINQRKIRKPGIAGFFSKKLIEVTAASNNSNKNVTDKNTQDFKDSLEAIRKAVSKRSNISNKSEDISKINQVEKVEKQNFKIMQDGVKEKNTSNELLQEMQEMKNILNSLVKKETISTTDNELIQKLKELDIDDECIEYINNNINSIKDDIEDEEKIKKVIAQMLNTWEEKTTGVMVLVGPTGVGKTTTIAKLAGRLSLIDNRKVGLITVDTYRIGAVEQLKTYADIMNIPFKVVFNISDMEGAIESMKDCDVVLIDTTGRSSKNSMQISELRAFIAKANTDNIHLVVSSTTKNKDILPIIEGYKKLNFNNVIITKLDETTTYGSILNILRLAQKPLSFVTTGQNVPDDIKNMNSSELCKLILGEDSIC